MMLGITKAVVNLGVSFEWIIMLLIIFAGLVFFSRGANLGFLMYWIMSMGVFMWFYAAGYMWQIPLVFGMMCFIVVCLFLYIETTTSKFSGGIL